MDCPKCGCPIIYTEHRTKDDKWRIHCWYCCYSTKEHDSRRKALKEFKKARCKSQ